MGKGNGGGVIGGGSLLGLMISGTHQLIPLDAIVVQLNKFNHSTRNAQGCKCGCHIVIYIGRPTFIVTCLRHMLAYYCTQVTPTIHGQLSFV